MQTPDLTDKNIEWIASLFPSVITETKDENGNIKKAVDFDLLKQALSNNLVEGDDERYRLDWPGKKASLLKANTPITKTLRPCREESVNFDTTENLYIEGDNFEVLKILQESYLGKIKMIYIDPPYNTGKDFIYKDDFKKSKEDYEEELGIEDEEGGKLFRNTDSNGRFHSDWLSMMYERLVVARDLLKDDGAIFISIDDNEMHNLRKICDEIFGEENCVGVISRMMKSGGNKGQYFSPNIEYIIVFAKSINSLGYFREAISEDTATTSYSHIEEFGERKGEKYSIKGLCQPGLGIRKNQRYWIKCPDGSFVIPRGVNFPTKVEEGTKITPTDEDTCWKWIYDRFKQEKEKNNVVFKPSTSATALVDEHGNTSKWNVFNKIWLTDRENEGRVPVNFISKWENRISSQELKGLDIPFDFAKPSKLVNYLISLVENTTESIILDFFSGSATTAHAVMQLNAEDGGTRKFIMVQLLEKTDEGSEAYKAGYKTIAEIGKERIRRAGKKIVEELKVKNQQLELGQEPVDASKLDIGFRVYKTDESNMKDVFYHPVKLDQQQLVFLESNIKEDRAPEDLLTQVILDLGLELSLPVETKKIGKNTVFIVQANALVTCFDNDIDFKIVDTIAALKPFKVVFKDASFKDDKDRINVEERFKRLSPGTRVTVI